MADRSHFLLFFDPAREFLRQVLQYYFHNSLPPGGTRLSSGRQYARPVPFTDAAFQINQLFSESISLIKACRLLQQHRQNTRSRKDPDRQQRNPKNQKSGLGMLFLHGMILRVIIQFDMIPGFE